MNDWQYAQTDPREQLAHALLSIKKLQGEPEMR
jgi:hypothetical protein